MDEHLKRRLVGATVLVSLGVIFIPMLFDEQVTDQPRLPLREPPPAPQVATVDLLKRELPAPDPLPQPVTEAPPVTADAAQSASQATPASPATDFRSELVREEAVEPGTTVTEPETQQPAAPDVGKAEPRTGLRAWAVQVGSFSERAKAEALVARLRKAGFEAMEPDEVVVKGKTWFRVRVGPEVDRARSEKQLLKIDKISGLKGLVVRYP